MNEGNNRFKGNEIVDERNGRRLHDGAETPHDDSPETELPDPDAGNEKTASQQHAACRCCPWPALKSTGAHDAKDIETVEKPTDHEKQTARPRHDDEPEREILSPDIVVYVCQFQGHVFHHADAGRYLISSPEGISPFQPINRTIRAHFRAG